jgi:flagellar L-ring protein precursor FlgH
MSLFQIDAAPLRSGMELLGARVRRLAILPLCALALQGCQSGGQVQVHHPLTARPLPNSAVSHPTDGAIFGGNVYRPLFEDRRPRVVGDTITIVINESLQASQTTASSAERKTGVTLSVPIVQGLPGKSFQGAALSSAGDNNLNTTGASSNVNVFTGTMTCTVVDILPNGNLLVAGERQIGISANAEYVRFSGVVTPATIQTGNQVSSTQVADVRLEYVGRGYIDQAQAMPWLQRFFLSVSPF